MKRPKPVKTVCLPGQKPELLIPIEAEMDLVTHVDFEINGRQFGAYFLRISERKFRLVFGFDCFGIHPNLPDERVDPICNRVAAGFKDLPEGEILTIHMKSFIDHRARMQELSQTIANCESDVLKYILMTEQKRLEVLSAQGLRKSKSLTLFATYTFDPEADVKDDKVEGFTKGVYKVFSKFSGTDKIVRSRELMTCLEQAVTAFYHWEQVLGNKMGLGVRVMQAEELWANLWYRFNDTLVPPLPQRLIFKGKTVSEHKENNLHPLSILINEESSLPDADYRWVRVKNKYIGVMSMLSQPNGWDDNLDALTYIWDKLGEDSIYDIEAVVQLRKVNQDRTRKKLKDLTDEEVYKSQKADAEGDINVAANMNAEEAIEAQAILHRGEVELAISSNFLVHRNTVAELDTACDYLKSLFLYPAHLHREYTYTWLTWLQTFPTTWDMSLSRPFNREEKVFTYHALAAVPLAKIDTHDRGGFELISDIGGVPVYIDLIDTHHHALIVATTRAGKTVVITGMLNGVLANNIPVTIIDCPPMKEAASFRDYAHLLGGAYFDVGSESSNIFEVPNFSQMSDEEREDRNKEFEESLLEILQMLVVGSNPDAFDPLFRDTIRSLLRLVLTKFFDAREIQSRYIAAITAGVGSDMWQRYPVLGDFIGFCSPERVKITEQDQLKALSYIVTKLRSWTQSRTGQAFCRPSTFKTDSQLFVMAIRGVANAEDMAILSTVAYATAIRRAYSNPKSVLFLDEAASLLKFPALALTIGRLLAIAAKAGIRVILASQEVHSIKTCAGGEQILANCDIKLVGRIQPEAVDAISEVMKIPLELLAPNLTTAYAPNTAWGYSNWLVLDGRSFTQCRAYACAGSLAAVVNNTHEVDRRKEIMSKALHPIIGLAAYANELLPI